MSQKNVLNEIAAERRKQNKEWGGASHDDGHSANDWIDFLNNHLGRAARAQTFVERRYQLIRVAALAVAAVESYDRNTKRS